MREEFGELDEMARLFVMMCESVVRPEMGMERQTTDTAACFAMPCIEGMCRKSIFCSYEGRSPAVATGKKR